VNLMTSFQVRKKLCNSFLISTFTGFYLRKKFFKLGVAATLTGVSIASISTGQAQAVVVTFDDIPNSGYGSPISNGYAGLNWDNFGVLNTLNIPSGYQNGTVSKSNIAYNGAGYSALINLAGGGTFDFNSTYLTAAWNNGLNILVEGFLGVNTLYSTIVNVDTTSPTKFDFNFLGIDQLKFTSYGGSNAGYNGSGTHFAVDNLAYNEPVPEPITILGTLAAGGIGTVLRRKSKKQAKENVEV
jgi:hypothetical protein